MTRNQINNTQQVTTTQYAMGMIYKDGELEYFSQPEGYVQPAASGNGYEYVYQYKDHLGNVRLSYQDKNGNGSIESNSEIVEENNYYPFGMKHKGYNNLVNGTENNYKQFQGQEYTEDLGLNIHEWKYRISDPAIGRFWQVDPLAEDYVYNGVYNFSENRVVDGKELEGLEWQRFIDGLQSILSGANRLGNEVANVERQMNKRGFSGGKRAEIAKLDSREAYSRAAGQSAEGAEDMMKGGGKVVGESSQIVGDGVNYIGMALGQPEVSAFGKLISGSGTVLNSVIDVSDGKPIKNVALEQSVNFIFGKASKKAVKATRNVAGKGFVESGKNKTTEIITAGSVDGLRKITNNTIRRKTSNQKKNKDPVCASQTEVCK